LIHHLLAAYSLGASKEKIQEIFDIHAKDQRPLPPSVGEITRENYKDHLGEADAYTSYLKFYQFEIEKYGTVDTARRWIWCDDMLARTVAGVLHPLIHIGYGLEFDIPGIVAEGLAMAAVTESHYLELVPKLPDLNKSALVPTQAQAYAENATSTARGYMSTVVDTLPHQISARLGISEETTSAPATDHSTEDAVDDTNKDVPSFLKDNSLFLIFNQIRKDSVFDNLFKASDNEYYKILLGNQTTLDRLKYYVNKWSLEENTEDIQAKLKEVHTLAAVALGSTGIRKDYPGVLKLDFFIMHALNSSAFLHHYISKITPSESASLLKAQLAIFMVYYITAGRPEFNIDGLLDYKSPTHDENSNNNWLVVIDKALACEESHILKVVRSCAVASVIYGPHEEAQLNAIWLKVAQMAIDKDGHWNFAGSGFDFNWTSDNEPERVKA
jgi:hypothetical protein